MRVRIEGALQVRKLFRAKKRLIHRLKVALAQAAGASGLIIGNNDEENPDDFAPAVTLGEPTRPQGGFVPTVVISLNSANALTQAVGAGEVTASITVDSQTDTYPTDNVIATSYMGDQDNVVVGQEPLQ